MSPTKILILRALKKSDMSGEELSALVGVSAKRIAEAVHELHLAGHGVTRIGWAKKLRINGACWSSFYGEMDAPFAPRPVVDPDERRRRATERKRVLRAQQ